jgi:hypothetical protein
MSKDLLVRDAFSADHYTREVKTNQTELANILSECKDTIFKVNFKKKVDEKAVLAKLSDVSHSDLQKADFVKKLSKEIIEGKSHEMVCHLTDAENPLGRSSVIDLNAPTGTNFRLVDHRTIDSIIYKNVKYSLGKKDPSLGDLPLKLEKDAKHWDDTKLAVGNWFSSVIYYKVKSVKDADHVMVATNLNTKDELMMSKDILQTEMHSGQAFDKQEKVSRSEMVEHLMNAKETVMTVGFRKKIDDAYVKDILSKVTAA